MIKPRPLAICWRLLQILFSSSIALTSFAALSIKDSLRGRPSNRRLNFGMALAHMFEMLGGAYLKLGQLLASRPDLLHHDTRSGLSRLHTAIKPLPQRHLSAIIAQQNLRAVFSRFDIKPIASGSIAQVHYAELRDGREVAVKLRRPRVERAFQRDIMVARSLLTVAATLPRFRSSPLLESFDVFSETLLAQLDLLREAELTRAFRQRFAQSRMVLIPQVIEEYSDRDMIVMEYYGDLLSLDRRRLPTDLWEIVATRCLNILYQMIFIDGLVHGDLHPGNIFARPDGSIVVLDFGLTGRMEEGVQRGFVDFFLGFVRASGAQCADVALRLATRTPIDLDRTAFIKEMQTLVTKHTRGTADTFQVGHFALEIFEIQRRYGIRSTTGFILPITSLLILEGTLKELHPRLDFQTEALKFLFAAMYGAIECHVE